MIILVFLALLLGGLLHSLPAAMAVGLVCWGLFDAWNDDAETDAEEQS